MFLVSNNTARKILKIVLLLAIIIGIALSVFAVFSFIKNIRESANQAGQNATTTKAITKYFTYQPGIINVLTGTIQEKTSNYFVVKTLDTEKNPLLKNKTFKVIINAQTKLISVSGLFSIVVKNNEPSIEIIANKGAKQQIASSDFKINDIVIVFSASDFRYEKEFIAQEICKRQ